MVLSAIDWDKDDPQVCFVNNFLFAYNRPKNAGSTQMHLGGKRDCQEQHSAKRRILCQRSVRVYSFDSKTMALFSSEKISNFATVALSFLFDKYCLIMN